MKSTMTVKTLFGFLTPSEVQYRLAYGIVQKIRSLIISKAAEPYKIEAREAARKVKTVKDSKGSNAKIRYIGGWCLASLRFGKKRLVSSNLYKKSVRTQVNTWDKEIRFLDQLEESCDSKETNDDGSMIEIDRKQNLQSGLTVINNNTFKFFVDLDSTIQKMETFENLNLHMKDFYHFIISELKKSEELSEKWRLLFHTNDDLNVAENSETLDNMLIEIMMKYIKMSSNQFRNDYKRDLKIQKEEAHRKQIRIRETKKVAQHKIDFQSILDDESSSKLKSHLRLRSEIVGCTNFLEIFNKDQLSHLGGAYSSSFNKKISKKTMIESLNEKILNSETMPNPEKLLPERLTGK